MNMRLSTLVAAFALAMLAVVIGALVAVWSRPQSIVAATSTSPVRQITVVGKGEAKATPDKASVQLGVQTEAETARQALTDNNGKMQALIDKLKELGVAEKDIQTSNISIYPRYDDKGRDVLGYQVSNTVTVTIRNISQTGELLDKVVDAGANSVMGIAFTIDQPSAVEQQARDAAIKDARARAEAMAQATSANLGQVLSITENIGATPPPVYPMAERSAMAADAAAVPIQSGEQTINAQVQITYELR
ncbi:MAG TPA: SIMPL domain-containing protein [Herpetosiphonaceae bacterium]